MTVLCLYAGDDTPGKRDSTAVFRPEAERLAIRRRGRAYPIDVRGVPMRARFAELLEELHRPGDAHDSLALFCHGWSRGIQLGPCLLWGRKRRMREVDELAHAIRHVMGEAPTVVLYACSTGSTWLTGLYRRGAPGGDGGFADELRDALCRAGATGCVVYAHDRKGHATRCPYVRRFAGPSPGVGGEWLIEPGSELWPAWRAALWGDGDLRLRFPWMTRAKIEAELLER